MIATLDTTNPDTFINYLTQPLAQEERVASDIVTPIEYLIAQINVGQITFSPTCIASAAHMSPTKLKSSISTEVWRTVALDALEKFRHFQPGWDGLDASPPEPLAIEAAETLCVFLTPFSHQRRPRVSLDAFGVPTFVISDGELYLHLTVEIVDGLPVLAWYAEYNGTEYFEDNVAFHNDGLPTELLQLLLA